MEETIYPFELNIEFATFVYDKIKATGAKLSGWSPSNIDDEFITVWDVTPEQRKVLLDLRALGAIVGMDEDTKHPGILVQKHDWWLRDHYNQMNDEEQMQADLIWLRMGGHLVEEKMKRLRNSNLI